MLAINAKTTEGARKLKEARTNKIKTAAANSQSKTLDSIREGEKEDDTSVATPKISNTNGEEVKEEEEGDVKDEELEGNPVLKQYSTFTLDELDSVNYQRMEDNKQLQGSGGRFSGRDLMKFIPSTINEYCLMIYIDPHLHLLHSAFRCGDWMYASTSRAGVDNFWMRIPVSHLTMPLKSLNFDVLGKEGNPIKGKGIPMYRDLFTQQVYGLSKANLLFSVPVDTARDSARPARATLITGSLYSALV